MLKRTSDDASLHVLKVIACIAKVSYGAHVKLSERPLWIAVPGAFLVALVAIFGRFEQRGRTLALPAR
jgi:hypothetical protein